MSSNSEFLKFVQRQRERRKEAEAFDPKKELAFWLSSLDRLYKQIEEYLKDVIASGDVKASYSDFRMNEEFCGDYVARKMSLAIGTQHFSFTPIGTMLIGSRGRVDVLGPAGKAMLGLVDRNARGIAVRVKVYAAGQKPPEDKEPPPEIVWEWKIISRVPRTAFSELNKENFEEMLLSISNG